MNYPEPFNQIDLRELSWEEIRRYIYALDGSLPDTYVLETMRSDWQRWANFVNTHYTVKYHDENQQEQPQLNISAVFDYWDGDHEGDMPRAYICVGEVQVNCFFLSDDIIDGDIDPREFTSIDAHNHLMQYLSSISRLLGKRIVVLSEGTRFNDAKPTGFDPEPLLSIDGEQIMVHVYWTRPEA